jgi:cell division inhibitor SepF
MGAMYRLKAYFGMVPTEDMAEYADEPPVERYAGRRREYDRWGEGEYAPEREYVTVLDDPAAVLLAAVGGQGEQGAVSVNANGTVQYRPNPGAAALRAGPSRPVAVERPREPVARLDREPVRGAGLGPSAVRGALAMDTDALQEPAVRDQTLRDPALREPARLPERTPAPAVPEQRLGGAAALARITTLQPRSYNEARTIGERYRDGVPVIMNLTDLDDAAAKRLVDFAAGLAFALRGSIDKVTSRVFLLTPADVEVSADDARRLAERGLFRQD